MEQEEMKMRVSITQWVHEELRRFIRQGDLCIDATVGNGGDTEYLCGLTDRVIGFEIQEEALLNTGKRLELKGYHPELILDSHEIWTGMQKKAQCRRSCLIWAIFQVGTTGLPRGRTVRYRLLEWDLSF